MVSATVEITLLLLAAGVAGGLAGAGFGYVTSTVGRRRRTRDHLRRRLLETHRAIVMLERTAADESGSSEADTGTRLSERVATARDSLVAPGPQEMATPDAETAVKR